MNALKRILLAEDNPNDVELTIAGLSQHQLANEVVVTRDGVEALDYLYCRGAFEGRPQGNPAVVLLDIKMPRLDGLEVAKQMKSDPALREIPVVILTSSREERDVVESYALGVNAFVVKPVVFSDFMTAVSNLGLFWAVLNEPPKGSIGRRAPVSHAARTTLVK
jgi:CheY-like chemotaxis protein